MEDLIPLLIVIAISIIGAIGRKKRKTAGQLADRQTETPQRNDDLLSWFDKLSVENDEDNPFFSEPSAVKSTQVQTVTEKKSEATNIPSGRFNQFSGFITPEEREKIMSSEGIPAIQKPKDKNDLTLKESEVVEDTLPKQKFEFNLKQAVIYNEIMNRKYV